MNEGQVGRVDQMGQVGRANGALAAVVFLHLVVSFIHGAAHSGAQVALGTAGTVFVYVVILAGPLAGLAAAFRSPQTGGAIVAMTMAGALIFGLVNHFIISGADHVAHVAPAWRTLFASTAALLVIIEAAGTAIGARCAIGVRRAS